MGSKLDQYVKNVGPCSETEKRLSDYNISKNKKMYVTLSPCEVCAKAIVNSGIKEVVYLERYPHGTGIDILESCGIIVRTI